jgi:hypothetical protein
MQTENREASWLVFFLFNGGYFDKKFRNLKKLKPDSFSRRKGSKKWKMDIKMSKNGMTFVKYL